MIIVPSSIGREPARAPGASENAPQGSMGFAALLSGVLASGSPIPPPPSGPRGWGFGPALQGAPAEEGSEPNVVSPPTQDEGTRADGVTSPPLAVATGGAEGGTEGGIPAAAPERPQIQLIAWGRRMAVEASAPRAELRAAVPPVPDGLRSAADVALRVAGGRPGIERVGVGVEQVAIERVEAGPVAVEIAGEEAVEIAGDGAVEPSGPSQVVLEREARGPELGEHPVPGSELRQWDVPAPDLRSAGVPERDGAAPESRDARHTSVAHFEAEGTPQRTDFAPPPAWPTPSRESVSPSPAGSAHASTPDARMSAIRYRAPEVPVPAARGVSVAPAASSGAPSPSRLEARDGSWERLDPHLRTRVERVVERMATEHGHRVDLLEGYRSPERQAHLYAQGRTRPGPVVTWTRVSEHNSGRAADLRVDGSFEVGEGYRRLQQIAAEEGLITLGMKDPGHVELPNEGPSRERSQAPSFAHRTEDGAVRSGVAAVASAAPVARLATVARPVDPSVPTGVREPAAVPEGRQPPSRQLLPVGPQAATSQAATPPTGTPPTVSPAPDPTPGARAVEPRDEPQSGEPQSGEPRTGEPQDRPGMIPLERSASGHDPSRGPSQVSASGSNAMERAERVSELRALTEAIRPTSVSIRWGEEGGSTDRIRVGLLRNTVHADLDLADGELAARIGARVEELHRALERNGMDLGALRVNGVRGEPTMDALTTGRIDPGADPLRALLGEMVSDERRDGSSNRRWGQGQGDHEGSGFARSRRDDRQEGRNANRD